MATDTKERIVGNTESEKGGIFLATVSYLGILSLLPFILRTNNSFALFHARQGVVLWILEMLASAFLLIPFIGYLIFIFAMIGCLVLSLYGMFQACGGKREPLPVVGNLASEL